jgi:vancomycin resistance protein YoaR
MSRELATRSDSLPLTLAPPGGFPWGRLALSFLLTLLAVLVFAAAFAFGYARLHEDRVLPGVEIGGISLAGLDRRAAEMKLREELPPLSAGVLAVRYADVTDQISYSAIGRDYDMQLMLDQAMTVGHGGAFLDQVQNQLRILLGGLAVDPSVTFDSEQVAERVASVAARAEIAPVDATIVREDGRFVAVPAVQGQTVDTDEGIRLALAAVNNVSAANTSIAIEAQPIAPAVSTAQAQTAAERAERVVAADFVISAPETSTTIDAATLRGWVRLDETSAGTWQLAIEQDPITQFVRHLALSVDQPAENASFAFNADGSARAIPSSDGRAVDVEASSDTILAALQARADGSGPSNANLAIVPVAPEFTTAEAQQLAARVEMVSKWTTRFVPGVSNGGGVNISIPTSIIDGAVVQPGETFDFLRDVGPITLERGYKQGGAIINNRTREDGAIGGGICSCSTTLFNAAARAGLDMGARRNHAYYITRYPVGLDATVFISSGGSRQTMSFTNDTDYPILIRGINKRGVVTFQIWTVPTGRTVEFSEAEISDRKQAKEMIMYVDSLPAGKRKRVEYRINGFQAVVIRTVRDANGEVIHRDTFRSNYRAIDGITLLGRSPGDPKARTKVPFFAARSSDPEPTE